MAVAPRRTGPPRSTLALAKALVGAWRLESTVQRLTDGTIRPSPLYGANGVGYLIYSASGQMCAMLADPSRKPWSSPDEPTAQDLQALYAHFIAYCGRYEVNEPERIVLHHIELHVTPNCIGTVFARRVSLEGSRLTLRPLDDELPPGMLEYTLMWSRVETSASISTKIE